MINIYKNKHHHFSSAFTIVELLVVIVTIAILAAVSLVAYNGWQTRVAATTAKNDLLQVASAMQDSKNFSSGYPVLTPGAVFNGGADTKNLFVSSPDIQLTYKTGDATTYCVEAQSKSISTVTYYLDAAHADSPTLGTCTSGGSGGGGQTPPPSPTSIADDFNRTGSTLGNTSVGNLPWQVLTPGWSTDGSHALPTNTASTNPLAVVQTPWSDVDMQANINPEDALYFRVKDSSNWWRVREQVTYTQTTQTTSYGYCYIGSWSAATTPSPDYAEDNTAGTVIPEQRVGGSYCGQAQYDEEPGFNGDGAIARKWVVGSTHITCQAGAAPNSCFSGNKEYTRTVYNVDDTTSTYSTAYYGLILEKSVGGVVSQVWAQPQTTNQPTLARIVAQGNNISVYNATSGSALTTQSDSFDATATEHGIGRHATGATYSYGLDNFSIVQP